MRLTATLLFTICMYIPARLYAQHVSLSGRNLPLEMVFKEIRKQTGFTFLYTRQMLKPAKKVTLKLNDVTLEYALNYCFRDQPLTYSILNTTIVVSEKTSADTGKAPGQSLLYTLTGQILNEDKIPMGGATVSIKGMGKGVSTDSEGRYFISVQEGSVLEFSFVGHITQEIRVGGQPVLNVILARQAFKLDDIVVMGYGTQRKRDITGSVASVSAKDITAVATTNIFQAIQGKVSGVVIQQDNWRPGATSTIRIRGNRSINATNDPLYIIDGIPIGRGGGTINDFNPEDIESIDILKDASATSIYGSRGSNGVILITTKRGKSGKTSIEYSGYEGFQYSLNTVRPFNAAEYADYVREAYRNVNSAQKYLSAIPNKEEDMRLVQFSQDPYVLESVLMGYDEHGNYDPSKVRGFDWLGAVMQNGNIRSHQLSARGGNENTKVMTSVGYFGNRGLIKNMDYERFNARLNIDHHLASWLKLFSSTMISRANEDLGTDLYDWARQSNPLASPYGPDGKLQLNPGNDPLTLNPLLDIDGVSSESRQDRMFTNLSLEANIFKGLRYRINLGYDHRVTRDGLLQKSNSIARSGKLPLASYGGSQTTDLVMENLIFYEKKFKDHHQIGFTFLQSIQSNRFETDQTTVQGIPYESQEFYNLGTASEILSTASRLEEWRMFSLMGRINYSLFGKYLLTITGRRDGSSVLAEGRKYKFFPSVAFAWRLSDERFLKTSRAVNELKLRVSYGRTGNSSVLPYQTQGNLSLIRYVWDETPAIGFAPGLMQNPNLSWEGTDQVDVGVDFALFGNRVSGTVDVYQATTHDLIMDRSIPITSGFESIQQNVGSTRNQGIEVRLSSVNIVLPAGFTWRTGLTFTRNKEQILSLVYGEEDDIGSRLFIGYPRGSFYDYEFGGIWSDSPEDLAEMEKFNANGNVYEPGLIRVVDQNGDYKINGADRKILGSPVPDWTAGLTNELQYKSFDLAFQFYTSQGAMGFFEKAMQLNGRQNMIAVDYWRPDHQNTLYPKPSAGWHTPTNMYLNYFEDISFVRLRYVTLGYTFYPAALSRIKMTKLRIYASAQNPYLHTKFSGIDPEGAVGSLQSPSTKTFMMGIDASF